MNDIAKMIHVSLLVFMISYKSYSQEDLVDSIIGSELFYNSFLLYNQDEDEIIYDRTGIIKKEAYYNNSQKITVVVDSIYGIFYTASSSVYYRYRPRNLIVLALNEYDESKEAYVMIFWKPYSGKMLDVWYRKEGDKYVFLEYSKYR